MDTKHMKYPQKMLLKPYKAGKEDMTKKNFIK